MQPQRLAGAFGQHLAVAHEPAEAANVHIPQIGAGFAANDPLGHQAARAAAVGNASRVEPGANKIIAQLRRFAEDEVAIRCEALGAIEQHFDLGGFQARRAVNRIFHQRLELVPVFAQQLELKGRWNRIHLPRLGRQLKPAHHQAADFFLVINQTIGVAHHWQHGVHAGNLAGDDVKVFGAIQRNRHPCKPAELPRPLASAVHQGFAANGGHFRIGRVGVAHLHAHRAAVLNHHTDHLHALHNFHATVPRALGQRHAQIRRVGFAVAWQPDAALQIFVADDGVFVFDLCRRNQMAFDAEAVRHRRLFFQHLHALRRARYIHTAALFPARGQARFCFQARIQLNAVFRHRCHVAVGPHLPHQPGRVPGGAAGQLALFQQQHVGAP